VAGEEVLTQITSVSGMEYIKSGKVREIFRFSDNILLLVATDRVSAFDCVLPTPIPLKGKVLTGLSKFWFMETRDICPNHFVSTRVADFVELEEDEVGLLSGRCMLVEEAKPVPFECIVRGYLCGSAWEEYKRTGKVGEEALPAGLDFGAKLDAPLLTLTTKAQTGHDQPVGFEALVSEIGEKDAARLKKLAIELYQFALRTVFASGLVIADTKIEFGYNRRHELCVIDEFGTPDSSRFWLKSDYKAGKTDQFYDKQFIRGYLKKAEWDGSEPAPQLPDEVVAEASRRYCLVHRMITGKAV